jgi:hypothetical protein
MSAVENRADSNRESAGTIAALPTLITAIAARMPSDIPALTIGTYWAPAPTRLFKVVDGLFVGLEGLKEVENVHGCTVLFDALPYLNPSFCQVQKRTIPINFIG